MSSNAPSPQDTRESESHKPDRDSAADAADELAERLDDETESTDGLEGGELEGDENMEGGEEVEGDDAPPPRTGPIIAKAGRYYRNARYLMTVLILGFGVYFLYDGYIAYPKENKEFLAKPENRNAAGEIVGKPPHSDLDLWVQILLGWTLIPGSFVYFAYFLHRSRGAYVLDGDTLSIPGHPPFTLADITALDKKLWDRKGIAHLSYTTTGGKSGKATLDDFIYDRKPTDEIYDVVVYELKSRGEVA